jgi:hypothetical protein
VFYFRRQTRATHNEILCKKKSLPVVPIRLFPLKPPAMLSDCGEHPSFRFFTRTLSMSVRRGHTTTQTLRNLTLYCAS